MDPSGLLSILAEHNTSKLLNITPKQIDDLVSTITGRITLGGVSIQRLIAWKSLYPEVEDTHRYRYEYDSRTCQVVIKCIAEPISSALGSFFIAKVEAVLRSHLGNKTFESVVQLAARKTTFTGFSGVYHPVTQKVPDAFYRVVGDAMPTVVCSTGWVDNITDLYNDSKVWLLGTGSQTTAVIVLVLHEKKIRGPVPCNYEAPDSPDERQLLMGISHQTLYHNLAADILDLHHRGELSEPLLGKFQASVHIMRRNAAGNDVDEAYGATVFPVLAAHDPQFFSLTLGDLLGQRGFQLKNYNAGEKIQFPLAILRNVITQQLQQQAKLRSYSRAISIMKSMGFWKDRHTVVPQGIKRKWLYS